jgi:hypothetical protein
LAVAAGGSRLVTVGDCGAAFFFKFYLFYNKSDFLVNKIDPQKHSPDKWRSILPDGVARREGYHFLN